MAAKIIDGKLIASKVKEQVSVAVSDLNQKSIFPGLATIIVGNDAASSIYVKNKRKSAKEVGIESFQYELSENIEEKDWRNIIYNYIDLSFVLTTHPGCALNRNGYLTFFLLKKGNHVSISTWRV